MTPEIFLACSTTTAAAAAACDDIDDAGMRIRSARGVGAQVHTYTHGQGHTASWQLTRRDAGALNDGDTYRKTTTTCGGGGGGD